MDSSAIAGGPWLGCGVLRGGCPVRNSREHATGGSGCGGGRQARAGRQLDQERLHDSGQRKTAANLALQRSIFGGAEGQRFSAPPRSRLQPAHANRRGARQPDCDSVGRSEHRDVRPGLGPQPGHQVSPDYEPARPDGRLHPGQEPARDSGFHRRPASLDSSRAPHQRGTVRRPFRARSDRSPGANQ